MDRAGNRASPLTTDEFKLIFASARSSQGPGEVRRQLLARDRTTVYRAYNVVAEFERRTVITLDNQTAQAIAEVAKYSATVSYVQDLFLRWRTWHISLGFERQPEPIEHLPRLQLGPALVILFTDGLWMARYAVVEVQCISKVEAVGCWHAQRSWSPRVSWFPLIGLVLRTALRSTRPP